MADFIDDDRDSLDELQDGVNNIENAIDKARDVKDFIDKHSGHGESSDNGSNGEQSGGDKDAAGQNTEGSDSGKSESSQKNGNSDQSSGSKNGNDVTGNQNSQSPNDSKSKERNFTNELGYGDRFCYLKNVMGMFVYNQLRKEYKDNGETLSHDTIVKLISEAPYLEKFIDVDNPKLSTPFNMSLKLRSILAETNQTPPTFAGQWFSMIYESMACKYRHTIDRLKEATNRDFKRIVVGGGGNQAELLNQYTANVTNMIVEQGAVEATVLGNALAQFISLGAIKSVEEGREIIEKSFSGKKYFPNNVDDWNKKYERFKRAVIKEDKD